MSAAGGLKVEAINWKVKHSVITPRTNRPAKATNVREPSPAIEPEHGGKMGGREKGGLTAFPADRCIAGHSATFAAAGAPCSPSPQHLPQPVSIFERMSDEGPPL